MAFHVRDEQDDVMGDINVTPLVDVMLVLLIIFMVATPMLHQGIQVALPRADARNLPLKVQDPIVLSINRDGEVFLRDARVPLSELADRIKDRLAGRPELRDHRVDPAELGVPVGVLVPFQDLGHALQRVAVLFQDPRDGVLAGPETAGRQLPFQVAQRQRRPPQRGHRIAPGPRIDKAEQFLP